MDQSASEVEQNLSKLNVNAAEFVPSWAAPSAPGMIKMILFIFIVISSPIENRSLPRKINMIRTLWPVHLRAIGMHQIRWT